jgi:hypothetical protein
MNTDRHRLKRLVGFAKEFNIQGDKDVRDIKKESG